MHTEMLRTLDVCLALVSMGTMASAFMPTTGFLPQTSLRSGVSLRGASLAAAAPRKNVAASLRMAATTTGQDTAALARAATEARGLAMDSIAAAHSGHLGLPLGCAEVNFGSSATSICDAFPDSPWAASSRLHESCTAQ